MDITNNDSRTLFIFHLFMYAFLYCFVTYQTLTSKYINIREFFIVAMSTIETMTQ